MLWWDQGNWHIYHLKHHFSVLRTLKTLLSWSWRDGSMGRALAVQTWGLAFESPAYTQMRSGHGGVAVISGHLLSTWSPGDSTTWGSSANLSLWSLGGWNRSLGWAFDGHIWSTALPTVGFVSCPLWGMWLLLWWCSASPWTQTQQRQGLWTSLSENMSQIGSPRLKLFFHLL